MVLQFLPLAYGSRTSPFGYKHKLALALSLAALDSSARAVPTCATSILHTDLVIPALGHLRTARGGRVLDGNGRALKRVYASGRTCVDDARRVRRCGRNSVGLSGWRHGWCRRV